MKRARELSTSIPNAWYPCQHENPLNCEGHNLFTAREIVETFDGAPDAIVVGVSTAGQLAGLVKFFAPSFPKTKFIGVDVAGSVIFGTPAHPYKMTGLGLSFVPPSFDRESLSAAYSIRDDLAFSVCRELARREGLLLGASTGAIVAAGLNYGSKTERRQKILMINPDRGDRYLETIFDDNWIASQGIELLTGQRLEDEILALSPVFESNHENHLEMDCHV